MGYPTIIERANKRDRRTEGEKILLDALNNTALDGWTVYEQPHINGVKPDFILMHPDKGVVIIEVKDWNLDSPTYLETGDGMILGTNGMRIKRSPINQVLAYRNCILKMDLLNTYRIVNQDKWQGYIETVVYFHGASPSQVQKFLGNSHYPIIWTDEDVTQLSTGCISGPKRFPFSFLCERSKFSKEITANAFGVKSSALADLVKELSCRCSASDYISEKREPFELSKWQMKQATTARYKGSIRRCGGVAGAGKTLVLAQKAVYALKEGYNVLILTFNITLCSYIRDLCSQQFGLEKRERLRNLDITHFHGFLMRIMGDCGLSWHADDENIEFATIYYIDTCMRIIKKEPGILSDNRYDYILFDEAQDFNKTWVLFCKSFWTGNGEFFFVYDKAQNIYRRDTSWIESENKGVGFHGKPGSLNQSLRVPNKVALVINQLGKEINDPSFTLQSSVRDISQQTVLGDLDSYLKWKNIPDLDQMLQCLAEELKLLHTTHGVSYEDITIIVTDQNAGYDVLHFLKDKYDLPTMHVFDESSEKKYEVRRYQKFQFTPGTGRLKLCTYQSYKGFQTPHVILLLTSGATRDALFISLSRVKMDSRFGKYSFTCLNNQQKNDKLESIFRSAAIE